MSRPIILGVVGDSASGKTTLTRGLVRVLGQEQVSHVCLDDYHRYDRSQRAEMGVTPLDPGCNHMDIMGQHLMLLRRGEAIMKPVYRHSDGTFAPPVYLAPGRFLIVEGLLGYHTDALRDCFDIRVFLDPSREPAPPVEGGA
jgi:phosphoribulokinase